MATIRHFTEIKAWQTARGFAEFDQLAKLTQSARKLIAGFMDYLKDSTIPGQKYKRPAGGRPQRGTGNRKLET